MSHPLWIAALVTLAFAVAARLLRGVTNSGAIAGAAICFVLYAGCGVGAFATLVSVFVVTWGATRLGYQRKQNLGVAEKRAGRKASQVLANLAISGICGSLYWYTHRSEFLVATLAALTEAAADTVSSEVGQASGKLPRLVTSGRQVPAGTDGGVTAQGTTAGILAGLAIGAIGMVGLGLAWRQWLIATVAGISGMVIDSYLGALLERRRMLNNDLVNLVSTAVAATVALVFG
jgi:uncharacterized protein (TIGR00297 family)